MILKGVKILVTMPFISLKITGLSLAKQGEMVGDRKSLLVLHKNEVEAVKFCGHRSYFSLP